MQTTTPVGDGTVAAREDAAAGGDAGTDARVTRRQACDFFGIKLRTWVDRTRQGNAQVTKRQARTDVPNR
jgi:hypothetical protein